LLESRSLDSFQSRIWSENDFGEKSASKKAVLADEFDTGWNCDGFQAECSERKLSKESHFGGFCENCGRERLASKEAVLSD
jgi:hypothetical protein